jgi:hypothetical protein
MKAQLIREVLLTGKYKVNAREGKVYTFKAGKWTEKKGTTTRGGYKQVNLFKSGKRVSIYVHQLVYFSVFDSLKRLSHKDGNVNNNSINNLYETQYTGFKAINDRIKDAMKIQ